MKRAANRLRELALNLGVDSYMIDNASQLNREWLQGKHKIGVTAGASAPEVLVQEVLARLKEWGVDQVTELQGKAENVVFARPKALA